MHQRGEQQTSLIAKEGQVKCEMKLELSMPKAVSRLSPSWSFPIVTTDRTCTTHEGALSATAAFTLLLFTQRCASYSAEKDSNLCQRSISLLKDHAGVIRTGKAGRHGMAETFPQTGCV